MESRDRRGLNMTFYVLKDTQKFIEARSIPRGKLGYPERSASGAVQRALVIYQWLVEEHGKTFKRWSERDWIILLRCLPSVLLFTGETGKVTQIEGIPELVEQEAKRLNLQRVMHLDDKVIPGLVRRLKNLSVLELIALYDQVETLRIEFLKNS